MDLQNKKKNAKKKRTLKLHFQSVIGQGKYILNNFLTCMHRCTLIISSGCYLYNLRDNKTANDDGKILN